MKNIIGFKMMVAEKGTKIPDFKEWKSTNIGTATLFTHETMILSKESLKANCIAYDEATGVMTFNFPKPMHEMELPEIFIGGANGIEHGKSNTELIYEN